MKFKEFLTEMAHINKFTSGWLKSNEAKALVKAFKAGEETAEVGDKSFKATKSISGKALEKGQVVLASYNSTNQGAQLYEIIGFTGDDKQYGDGGVKFNSAKDMLDHYKVKTLKELEELQDKNDYGYSSYLVIKDIATNDEGAWFYLNKGSWVRGSGAEKLSFTLVEEVKD